MSLEEPAAIQDVARNFVSFIAELVPENRRIQVLTEVRTVIDTQGVNGVPAWLQTRYHVEPVETYNQLFPEDFNEEDAVNLVEELQRYIDGDVSIPMNTHYVSSSEESSGSSSSSELHADLNNIECYEEEPSSEEEQEETNEGSSLVEEQEETRDCFGFCIIL